VLSSGHCIKFLTAVVPNFFCWWCHPRQTR